MARRHVSSDGTSVIEDGGDGRIGDRNWCRSKIGDKSAHARFVGYAEALLRNQENQHSKNRARERIYEGQELAGNRSALASLEHAGVQVARLNATKSIIDTFVSRLGKDRPMPYIRAFDTDWATKLRAQKFKHFVVGQMFETEFDDLSREALLDGGILGNGFTRIDDSDDGVFAERIHVNEMIFDQRECRYGRPQQAMRSYRFARDHLAELFPEHKAQIRVAPAARARKDDEHDRALMGSLDDYVDLFEGWHLPSTKESKDGRHALCLANATLIFERWHEPRFPWAHFRLFRPRVGLMGQGFVDQLASLQHRVNCIVRDLQLNLAATGRGHFLVNGNNDIPTEMLSGWSPFKIKYKGGQPPQYVAPTPFSPAQLDALGFFINKMYELTGVSQANAESRSSLGAGASGIALDTQYDIDSDRFRLPQGNYARYRLDASQRYIDAAKRVARKRSEQSGEKKPYVAVSWMSRDAIERIDFSEVELKDDTYCLQIEAVNFLPETRAGKLAVVEQLAKAGVIEQWLVPTLFDEPDLEQANAMQLSAFRNSLKKMDMIANPNKPMPMPEALNDLDLELKMTTAYYNRVQEESAPEEVQTRFRDYATAITEQIKKKNQAAQLPDGSVAPGAPMGPPMPQPAMPGMPPGMPMPPPGGPL